MYKKTVLDNGIKVITEEMPFFKSATIGVWVNTGSKDEPLSKNGISHFIEHMMFKGTATRSATEIAELMDSVGGQLNAFTEKEQTCYYARVIDRHVPMAIELLADMLLNSCYDPEEIERERGVVLDEVRLYEDSPDELIFDIFNKLLWDGHPLGRSILGTKKVIERISRDDLIAHVEKHYVAENLIIAAAGNIKHKEFRKLVERSFHRAGEWKGRKPGSRPVPEHEKKNYVKYKDCEQVYLITGGKGISQRDDHKYCLSVLDSILGGSMSSRIFQEIREKRGLVYNVCSFQNSFYHAGLFGLFAGTSYENLSKVISLMYQIVKEMKEKGVDSKELVRAKEQLKGTISLALESTSNRMMRLVKSEIFHGRLVPHEEVFEKIDAVTVDELFSLSQQLLNIDGYSTAILGPLEKGFQFSF
ncbi:MAG: pitrilysin family protein [Candidatus Eremiobacteraeota bacterium]|nr:pitrilysin family protein [Candidatus Eremiobacteraeota bacterium]